MKKIKLIECPRDAMQGLNYFIPTQKKADYINAILQVGFDTIDFGSFVNPKAILQMKDTPQLLDLLDLDQSESKLLAIVANHRGAKEAAQFEAIDYLGYPFSISEQFQVRNTGKTMDESLKLVEQIQSTCSQNHKKLVIYLSMAFGNPYDEPWETSSVLAWSERLIKELDVKILALSDTIGVSNQINIDKLFSALIPAFNDVEFGAHLHSNPMDWVDKVEAAWNAGCRRFDGAINGYGGCPMADDDLVGNIATENLIQFAIEKDAETGINQKKLKEAMLLAQRVFN